jgi:predicted RNase H-like nuclease (RuvC/YqgF family)
MFNVILGVVAGLVYGHIATYQERNKHMAKKAAEFNKRIDELEEAPMPPCSPQEAADLIGGLADDISAAEIAELEETLSARDKEIRELKQELSEFREVGNDN